MKQSEHGIEWERPHKNWSPRRPLGNLCIISELKFQIVTDMIPPGEVNICLPE